MQKFEYKTVTFASDTKHLGEDETLTRQFNQWGEQGWELVKMEPLIKASNWHYGSKTVGFLGVFKRPKQG